MPQDALTAISRSYSARPEAIDESTQAPSR